MIHAIKLLASGLCLVGLMANGQSQARNESANVPDNHAKGERQIVNNTDTKADIPDLFVLSGSPYRGNAKMTGRPLRPTELFLVLDLERPGLEAVKITAATRDHAAACAALLEYCRKRTEPNWSASAPNLAGQPASDSPRTTVCARELPVLEASNEDRRVADDAEKHIFRALGFAADYPPHDYGPDIDWDADPVNDIEWPCQMNRFFWSGPVTRSYSATGDERHARLWIRLVDDWIRKNPLTFERLPFPRSWDAIQVGIRLKAMVMGLPRFLDSPACSPEFLAEILTSIYNHARRIELMPYPRPDNFVQIETMGLASVVGAFPEFREAARWRTLAAERMWAAMQRQVLPDGVHGELAPGYHGILTLDYLELSNHLGADSIPPEMRRMTELMAEVCLALTAPDRKSFAVGDTHHRGSRKALLANAGRVLERPDFLAVATDGEKGTWPERRNFAFTAGGFYSFRSGWEPDAIWMGLHCGPDSIEPGGFHSQFDRGTFELMAFGRWLMVDPGIFNYKNGDPGREAFRRTAAHQCLTLNGANAARAGRCLQWIEDDGHGNAVLTVENSSYSGLTHRRTVFFVQRRWFVLVDEALGDATGELDLHFQLTPGPAVIDPDTKTARTDFPDGGNVLVCTDPEAPVTLEVEEAWYSPKWWVKEPLPAFRYRHRLRRAPARFVTVVAPYEGRQAPVVAAELEPSSIGARIVRLQISADGTKHVIERSLP